MITMNPACGLLFRDLKVKCMNKQFVYMKA